MASRSRVGSISEQAIFSWTVICMNAYNSKDREKIRTKDIVSSYPSIHCMRVRHKRVALY